MNQTISRDTPRHKLSLRYGAAHSPASTDLAPVAAMIPAIELRRLVATMVD
ncbi:hypothetical protein [Tsuneonella flava]|uniref:hypothetical protein n=1 Tax=Tsuneonella flava TaxID=2055955 RepID=UPI001E347C3F|nr:hypothetical protein [Tsuneonella flava]